METATQPQLPDKADTQAAPQNFVPIIPMPITAPEHTAIGIYQAEANAIYGQFVRSTKSTRQRRAALLRILNSVLVVSGVTISAVSTSTTPTPSTPTVRAVRAFNC